MKGDNYIVKLAMEVVRQERGSGVVGLLAEELALHSHIHFEIIQMVRMG